MVRAPGTGQIGEGLQNSWGLDENEDGEEAEDQTMEEELQTMDVKVKSVNKGMYLQFVKYLFLS